MATIWLDKAAWQGGDVPDVCLECGADAPDRVRKTLVYQPPWAYVTILLGLLVLVIVLLVTRKQFRSRLPLCLKHKNHWRRRELWIIGSFVLATLVGILGVMAANLAEESDAAGLILAVVLFCLIGWIVCVVVFSRGTIRVTSCTKGSILLTNVSAEFADAYENKDDQGGRFSRERLRIDPDALRHWEEPRGRRQSGDPHREEDKYRPE